MAARPRLEIVRQPFALPNPPEEPFVMLDVAFAGADVVEETHSFIRRAGDRLRLWVDHHEHPEGWARYSDDPRFVLVPSRNAHACPELVTPEVVARAGEVGVVLAHHDFDGLMSAVRFMLDGREPYEGANEDARAADSPGRGHHSSKRGKRLAAAVSQAGAELEEEAFLAFYRAVAESLLDGREPPELARQIDYFYGEAQAVIQRAQRLAETRRMEAPGVCVLRIEAQLEGNVRRAVLSVLEDEAIVGVVLEGTPKRYWATAATYYDTVLLDEVTDLNRGRHDFRFGPTKNAAKVIEQIASLVRRAGLA
jgi:hypothetical protein